MHVITSSGRGQLQCYFRRGLQAYSPIRQAIIGSGVTTLTLCAICLCRDAVCQMKILILLNKFILVYIILNLECIYPVKPAFGRLVAYRNIGQVRAGLKVSKDDHGCSSVILYHRDA